MNIYEVLKAVGFGNMPPGGEKSDRVEGTAVDRVETREYLVGVHDEGS